MIISILYCSDGCGWVGLGWVGLDWVEIECNGYV